MDKSLRFFSLVSGVSHVSRRRIPCYISPRKTVYTAPIRHFSIIDRLRRPSSANAASRTHTESTPKTTTIGQTRNSRRTRTYLIVGALVLYSATAWTFYIYTNVVKTAPTTLSSTSSVPLDVSDRYAQTAAKFDEEVDASERLLGIKLLRWWITRKAGGNVLEVSAGTGRNSGYYDLAKCKSVTLLDVTQEMVELAQRKWKELYPKYKPVRFLNQSALLPTLTPPGGFDTVIQTMGLCSTPDPAALLCQLGRFVKPDTGRIILLEHGRSHYQWMNNILDQHAPAHADRHGCWWNRDIGEIVERSGLEVVKMRRFHLGTTWWVELKVKTNRKDEKEEVAAVDKEG